MKDRFEVKVFMNCHIRTKDINSVSWLCNLIVAALEKEIKLPKYILVVVDSDIIYDIRFEKHRHKELQRTPNNLDHE